MRISQELGTVGGCRDCRHRDDSFLSDVSDAALRAYEAVRTTNSYPQGARLFGEGEEPRGLFVLCQGRAKLSLTSSEGKVFILGTAKPGEALALNSAVLGTPYDMTAELLDAGPVHFVRRDSFVRFLRQHADACVSVSADLAANYRSACEQIRSLGLSGTVLEKLARLLLDWANNGEPTGQGVRMKTRLTHEEIAQTIGTTRETVTRALAEFKHRRYAHLRGSLLLIQNREALGGFLRA
jgi:CRP/FNR family transcriptional regulator, cyclic AMP receptor protein